MIVGAGISGLAAPASISNCLARTKDPAARQPRRLRGHAKRNEFTTPTACGWVTAAANPLQSPRSVYSPVALGLLKALEVNIDELAKGFQQTFYPDLGLSRGVYFDEKHFGVNKVVSGDPGHNVADDIPRDRLNSKYAGRVYRRLPAR